MQTNDKNLDANKTSTNVNSHEISTENANSSQISNANLDNTSHAGQNQILDETSSANLSKIADESLGASSSQSDEFANKNQSATNTSKFGQNLKDRLKLNRPLSLNTKRKLAKNKSGKKRPSNLGRFASRRELLSPHFVSKKLQRVNFA